MPFGTGTLNETATGARLEEEKKPFVESTLRKQGQTLDYAKQLATPGYQITSPSEQINLVDQSNALRRQQLSRAAEDGVLHSGALGQARRMAAQKQALASAGLVAEEERARRERQMQIEQMRGAVTEAELKIPTRMKDEKGDTFTVHERERNLLKSRDKEIGNILTTLDKNRPSPEQLQRMFSEEIQGTYAQLSKEAVAEARRLGMSDQYVSGIQRSMEADMQRAIRNSDGMVRALSSPDPASVASYLQGIYRPDFYEAAQQQRNGMPMYGIVGGLLGGAVGLAATGGNPVGAAEGWGIGSGLGQLASTLG